MKIVYFGTSEIGIPILSALKKHHQVLAVVTTPDKPVGRKQVLSPSAIANEALRLNLPVLKPTKVKNNPEFLEELKKFEADIFVVVSYGKILPVDLLDIPPLKTINVHFSLLPKYRGPAPVQFALLNGETKTGTSIFILDELVDHGPILAMQELDIDPNDTNISLQSKLAIASADLILETLPNYESGKIEPQVQNHDIATGSKIISKEDGKINWDQTAQEIYNQFRAYQPWPGIYTSWQGKILKILDCRPHTESTAETITCGNNTYLQLITVQLEGKNPVSIKDFLNGYPDFNSKTLLW